jgi:hypothetical protein
MDCSVRMNGSEGTQGVIVLRRGDERRCEACRRMVRMKVDMHIWDERAGRALSGSCGSSANMLAV